jgi:putative Holliday junction resolvase
MRYLGIDYGARRIGIAVSDEAGSFAFPKETIPNDATSIDRIHTLVKRENIGHIVIGDTRAMNGVNNAITLEADAFARSLESHSKIPVSRSWEAWSSIEASRFAPKGKEHDDAAAAAIILQRFLDTQGSSHEGTSS